MNVYEPKLFRFSFGFDDVENDLKRKLIELFYANELSTNHPASDGQYNKYYEELLSKEIDNTKFIFSDIYMPIHIEFKFNTKNIEYLFMLRIHERQYVTFNTSYNYFGSLSLYKRTK